MLKLYLLALLAGYTGHVHQTRTVRTCDVFSTGLQVALYLVKSHLCRYGSFLYREHAAKATALIRTLRLYHVNAVNQL